MPENGRTDSYVSEIRINKVMHIKYMHIITFDASHPWLKSFRVTC